MGEAGFIRPVSLIVAHQRLAFSQVPGLLEHADYDCVCLLADRINASVRRQLHGPCNKLCGLLYRWMMEELSQAVLIEGKG
jgi:hypothetical protein